jgi:hypothetical protein
MTTATIDYARYGIGTTDQEESIPRKLRKAATCSGCRANIPPGAVCIERTDEAYTTGARYCLDCVHINPTDVMRFGGRQIVFGVPDTGKLRSW